MVITIKNKTNKQIHDKTPQPKLYTSTKNCIACKEKQVKKRKDMEQNDNLSKMLFLKFAKYFLHAKTFKDALQS